MAQVIVDCVMIKFYSGVLSMQMLASVCLECVNGQDTTVDPAKGGGTATLRLTSFGFYDYDTVTKCACYFHDIPKALSLRQLAALHR